MPEPGAFLHVEFDFDFNLLLARTSYVSFKLLDFITSSLVFILEVFDFAFQIDYKMSV